MPIPMNNSHIDCNNQMFPTEELYVETLTGLMCAVWSMSIYIYFERLQVLPYDSEVMGTMNSTKLKQIKACAAKHKVSALNKLKLRNVFER